MTANVGEMFYTGEVPWHGLGIALKQPATIAEALKVGGLEWDVEEVDLLTADDPPSPVPRRKALVRSDRPPGHEQRVIGVAHRDFRPIQNRDAALLFDAIFGRGKRVYHTGGYLGSGEKVWLLAMLDRTLQIGEKDDVVPFVLMANSHDGSMAFNIRLTTVRVVCQNTLSLAMKQQLGRDFRRGHQGSFTAHAAAAQDFFRATLRELDGVAANFVSLSKRKCDDETFRRILHALIPLPARPRNADRNPGLHKAWEARTQSAEAARKAITELRLHGKGQDLLSSRGTLGGALNAVLEYVDHHKQTNQSRVAYALLGDGMGLKMRAYQLIQDVAGLAA